MYRKTLRQHKYNSLYICQLSLFSLFCGSLVIIILYLWSMPHAAWAVTLKHLIAASRGCEGKKALVSGILVVDKTLNNTHASLTLAIGLLVLQQSGSGPAGVRYDPKADKEPGLVLQLRFWAFFHASGTTSNCGD